MRTRPKLAIAPILIAALASPAVALPTYGTFVDTTCTANGWVPAKPFNPNGGNPNDPTQANCGLCHTNAQNPGGSFTAAGAQFRASRHTDVAPFCAAPVTNRPPQFRPVAAQTASVGAPYQLTVTATDPDADLIVLAVSNAPTGARFTDQGNGTGSFAWTPGAGDVGSHTITFHAADTGTPMAVASLEVAIAVGQAANHPPVLARIGDQTADVGIELALSLSATDPDGDALSYSALGLPPGATLIGAEFRFTPDVSQVGNHPVTFTVKDDRAPPAMDSEAITITVGNTNRPPVLAPIGNRSAAVGARMQIALSATDPDRDALILACTGLPATASFTDLGDGTGVIDWMPGAAGSTRVSCTASDDGTPPLTDAEMFTMTGTAVSTGGSGAAIVDDARWIARGGKLVVRGHWQGGSGRRQPIGIYGVAGDGSTFLLGSGSSSREGRFGIEIRPFVAPCQVAAAIDGNPGPALAVSGAPNDCGEALLARARAELECDGDVLHVEGRRGPLGGAIAFVDATTGEDLARIQVRDRHGEFSFEGIVGSAPKRLQLRAELGSASWLLAQPLTVQRGECREGDDGSGHDEPGERDRE